MFSDKGPRKLSLADVIRQRTQEVVVGGHSSRSSEVTSEVSQGIVLDPLLFLTLINDLSDCVSSTLILFADDCLPHMWISGPEDAQDAQDLYRLQPWETDWQMSSNPSKCQVITIATNGNQPSYDYFSTASNLRSQHLQSILAPTYLQTLPGTVMCTAKKANRVLGFLRRNTYACPPVVQAKCYKAPICPILEYASVVWDPHTANLTNQLEGVQRRAARYVTG